MNIDVNSPLDELLETWAMYSQKLDRKSVV